MIHFLRELIKGSFIQPLNEIWYWNCNQTTGTINYLWVAWVEAADYVLAISLSLCVYKMIVRKENLSYKTHKRFFWYIGGTFLIYPLVYIFMMSMIITFNEGFLIKMSSCVPKSQIPSSIGIGQCLLAVTINAVIIGISLRYIWKVIRGGHSVNRMTRHIEITVRFVLIVICQLLPRLGYNSWYLGVAAGAKVGTQQTALWWVSTGGIFFGYYANALVVLVINRELRNWTISRFVDITASLSSKSTSSGSGSSGHSTEDKTKLNSVEMKQQPSVDFVPKSPNAAVVNISVTFDAADPASADFEAPEDQSASADAPIEDV